MRFIGAFVGAFVVLMAFAGLIPEWTAHSRTAAMAQCRQVYFDRAADDAQLLIPDCMQAKYFRFDAHCIEREGVPDPDGRLAKRYHFDAARCYRPVTPANWIASLLYDEPD